MEGPKDHGVLSRRQMIATAAGSLVAGAALVNEIGEAHAQPAAPTGALPPGQAGKDYTPVVTPNGAALPWKLVDGVKVYHLIAEEVLHEFAPGLRARCWGYNGRVHGPTIEAVEGDRVRIYVTNKLRAATSVHWHGMRLPNGMDGIGGLTQRNIQPGATFKYEFTLRQHGTLMYHSHHDEGTQMAMGMVGLFIIHPRRPAGPKVDRDFAILLHEWRIEPGTDRPNPLEMTDFNVLTMNAKAFPATESLVVRRGQRVRLRFGNLSTTDHHPIHLHNYSFRVVGTDGGDIPPSAQWPESTVIVPVGSTRTVELVADEPGDWLMHCHMPHHMMNQMGHGFPNMVGVRTEGIDRKVQKVLPGYMTMGAAGMAEDMMPGMPTPANSIAMASVKGPFDAMTIGGMTTILKVRDGLTSYEDPGWYRHPPGTVAAAATAEELRRDGIAVDTAGAPAPPPGHAGHGG